MEDYKTYLIEKGFSAHTVDSYLFAVRQLHEKVGGQPNNENLLGHNDWLAAHFAAKTVNLRITAINSYLDFIEYSGIRLKSLRIQQKPYLDNVISQEDYVLLRDSLLRDGELFWYYVVRFLVCTGARISELRISRWVPCIPDTSILSRKGKSSDVSTYRRSCNATQCNGCVTPVALMATYLPITVTSL